jgi:beta-galactosidase
VPHRSLTTAAAVTTALLPLAVRAVPLPQLADDPGHVVSLNANWRFKLEQADPIPAHPSINGRRPIRTPDHPEAFQAEGYIEGDGWHDLAVPGNWEMAGFSPATYGQPDNAIGLYRLAFDVPADWAGRQVRLNFDGVNNGAEVFLNGQPVPVDEPWAGRANYHEGGFDAFQVDLTSAVRFGGRNTLAIRVTKNTATADLDTGDFFFLGGVYRPVTLAALDPTHLTDLTVRTRVLPEGRAELRVLADVATPAATVAIHLDGQPPVEAAADANGHVELVQTIDHPRLWSAEHPDLYGLSVDVRDGAGRPVEHVTRRVGLREVSIEGGVLKVNHRPVKLAGMCRHEVDPALGAALTPDVWRRDLTLMKAANVNAVRTSHYPYGSGFYDLCDELGLYVADEEAACWVPTDAAALTPAFAQHARELVQRDKNHPSVILWAVGNENRPGKSNQVAADEIRRLDPTRPRLVSTENGALTGVELDDDHYPTPARAQKERAAADRSTTPQIYLEHPNVWEARNGADFGNLDRWAAVIDRAWKPIWADDHVGGSFLWEWRDRAVADRGPTHLYDYDPATGINGVKVKGVCDGFGDPRPAYYQVKVTYAPVKVDLRPTVAGSTVTVHTANHLSFTNLSELNTTWTLVADDGRELDHTTVHPRLAPWSSGEVRLDLPAGPLAAADAVRLSFDYPDGRNIATYQLRLRPERIAYPPAVAPAADVTFPHLNLTTVTYAPNRIGWHWATRHPGQLVNVTVSAADGGPARPVTDQVLYATPLSAVRTVEADVRLADGSTEPVGHVHVTVTPDGRFAYGFTWQAGPSVAGGSDVQELGWAFPAARGKDHFAWHRQGYWSYYPPDHIGRLAGVATPDSADVDITHVTRPDAFDFDSTKYDCDWAALTTAAGAGVTVAFDPADRQHCRAQRGPADGYQLVVDRQCSPPRDISSSLVPDYYLKLKRGETVAASFRVGSAQPPAH